MEATWRGSLGLLDRWGGFGGLITAGKIFLPAKPGEPAGRTRENVFMWRNSLQNETTNAHTYSLEWTVNKKAKINVKCAETFSFSSIGLFVLFYRALPHFHSEGSALFVRVVTRLKEYFFSSGIWCSVNII